MQPALLLNATYEPLSVISWQRALTLVLCGKAEMLERHTTPVRTALRHYELPSVLRLMRRIRVPRKPVQFSRTNIYQRDQYTCQYCADHFPPSQLTFDHVLPRSRGGDTSWLNIVTSCQGCNRHKGNRTPEEANMPLIKPPKEPRWSPFSLHEKAGQHPDTWQAYMWC